MAAQKKQKVRPRATTINAISIGIAFCAFLYSVQADSPSDYAVKAVAMLGSAATSIDAIVPANPYNTAAVQLDQKQAQLDQRESDVSAREAALREKPLYQDLGFMSFCFSIIVLVLVGINFYFDIRRSKKRASLPSKFSVDLR